MKRHKRTRYSTHAIKIKSDIREEVDIERPKNRSDCIHARRPCPWIMCRYHMIWFIFDSNLGKPIKACDRPMKYDPIKNYTDHQVIKEICDMRESCVLDIADRKGCTLEEIGIYAGVTRERIRQLEYYYKTCRETGEVKEFGAMVRLKHPSRLRKLIPFLEGR